MSARAEHFIRRRATTCPSIAPGVPSKTPANRQSWRRLPENREDSPVGCGKFTSEVDGERAAQDELQAALTQGRVEAVARLSGLGHSLRLGDGMEAIRAAVASLPSDVAGTRERLTGVFASAWARSQARLAPVPPDPARTHAADCLAILSGRPPTSQAVRALNAYWVCVIDHGMNASTFVARHPARPLRVNVEFYTAVLLEAIGVPRTLFSPMFAASRVAGWCAHIEEQRLGLAALLALGQVPADVPEGFTTIAEFKRGETSRRFRILASLSFALPIFLGTSIGYFGFRGRAELLKLAVLAFTAGVLTTLVVEELVPEAHAEGEAPYGAMTFVGGFALFTLLSAYFG